MGDSLRIRVVSGGRSVVVDAQPSWNLLFLRQVAATQLGLSEGVGERQLVLAGRALPDLMLVSELQPADDTCLHMASVQQVEAPPPPDSATWRSWRRFFVFCRTCAAVQEARLRLHCARCGSGAFLLPSPAPVVHSFAELTAAGLQGRCDDCGPAPMGYSFRCDAGDGHRCVPLPRVRANWLPGGYDCLACLERPDGPLVHFPCRPEHCLCLPCFRRFADEAMANQRFRLHARHGWTLFCPAGCADAAIDDPHMFLLLGADFYSRVKARGAEAAVMAEGGGFCPNPACGEAWLPAGDTEVAAGTECPACGTRVCRRCRRAAHPGDCAAREEEEAAAAEGLAPLMLVPFRPPSPSSIQSSRTVRAISRQCPGCYSPTERDGGCMHMTCARCGFEWCWICRRGWTRDCQAEHWFA